MSAQQRILALIHSEGNAVLCEFLLHLEHVFLVVVCDADSFGESLIDTVCEALGHHLDGLGVDVAVNDVDIYVVNLEIVAGLLQLDEGRILRMDDVRLVTRKYPVRSTLAYSH